MLVKHIATLINYVSWVWRLHYGCAKRWSYKPHIIISWRRLMPHVSRLLCRETSTISRRHSTSWTPRRCPNRTPSNVWQQISTVTVSTSLSSVKRTLKPNTLTIWQTFLAARRSDETDAVEKAGAWQSTFDLPWRHRRGSRHSMTVPTNSCGLTSEMHSSVLSTTRPNLSTLLIHYCST